MLLDRHGLGPGLSESAIECFEADAQIARDRLQDLKTPAPLAPKQVADVGPREVGGGGDLPHRGEGASRAEQLPKDGVSPGGGAATSSCIHSRNHTNLGVTHSQL